jgi:tRNA-modifying protein YgfZ
MNRFGMNTLEIFDSARSSGPFELRFGEAAAEAALALNGTVVAPLAHLGLIRASGADAEAFLQGQLSNDVRQVGPERAQLSSFNSPKGRMLAVLHVLRAGDAVLLELPRAILEPVLKRLSLYVLRSQVKLAEATDLVGIGVAGADTPVVLAAVGLPAPTAPLECAWAGDLGVVRRLGSVPRYGVVAPAERAADLWQRLKQQAAPVGTLAWKLLDIEAGVPAIYAETQDHFVPQMCNLDALGGISFDKGCYTGQEVVARVHYRGAVKRHMTKVMTLESGLAPGAPFALPDGRSAEVVESAPHPNGGTVALVVAADP